MPPTPAHSPWQGWGDVPFFRLVEPAEILGEDNGELFHCLLHCMKGGGHLPPTRGRLAETVERRRKRQPTVECMESMRSWHLLQFPRGVPPHLRAHTWDSPPILFPPVEPTLRTPTLPAKGVVYQCCYARPLDVLLLGG